MYLPTDALCLHVVQQHIHNPRLAPQGCDVQGSLPSRVPHQNVGSSLQHKAGAGCMAPLTCHKQGGGSPLVTSVDSAAQLQQPLQASRSGLGPPFSRDGSNDSSCAAYFSAVKRMCDRDLHKPESATRRDTFRLKRCVRQATPIIATSCCNRYGLRRTAQDSAFGQCVGTQECLNLAYCFEGVLEGRYRYYTLEAVHEVQTLLCVYTQPKCRALYCASKPIPLPNGDLRHNSAECRPA